MAKKKNGKRREKSIYEKHPSPHPRGRPSFLLAVGHIKDIASVLGAGGEDELVDLVAELGGAQVVGGGAAGARAAARRGPAVLPPRRLLR